VKVEGRASFPLASHRIEVLRAEGAVQLVLVVDGFPDGARRVANLFAGPETAGELAALAEHLRGLEWK
jgi:hypothetical protein